MPSDGEVGRDRFHLYCTDPTDGVAKFSLVAPTDLAEQQQASDPRTTLGMVAIKVDKTAPPLVERLELDVEADDDLNLSISAMSSQRRDQSGASYFDRELGMGLPGSADLGPIDVADTETSTPRGGLVVRAIVADRKDGSLIPGDVLYEHKIIRGHLTPSALDILPVPGRVSAGDTHVTATTHVAQAPIRRV
jgi:molecular chaperone DnaK